MNNGLSKTKEMYIYLYPRKLRSKKKRIKDKWRKKYRKHTGTFQPFKYDQKIKAIGKRYPYEGTIPG